MFERSKYTILCSLNAAMVTCSAEGWRAGSSSKSMSWWVCCLPGSHMEQWCKAQTFQVTSDWIQGVLWPLWVMLVQTSSSNWNSPWGSSLPNVPRLEHSFGGIVFYQPQHSGVMSPRSTTPGRRAWESITQPPRQPEQSCGTAGSAGCGCPPHVESPQSASAALSHCHCGESWAQLEGNAVQGRSWTQQNCHPHSFLNLRVYSSLFLIQVMSLWVMLV